MKAGDKFHINSDQDRYEVIEDTGKHLVAKNLTSGKDEEGIVQYHMVTDWPRCEHCGTPRSDNELKSEVIFFRDRHPRGAGRKAGKAFCNQKTSRFCIDKPCASHYQMGCEG